MPGADLRSAGGKVDLSRIAYDDTAVYDAICRGDTVGLFQIESRAQIQMLPRTQPRNLDDLAVQVAIVRPGPIVGGAVNPYVQRRERLRRDPTYRARADHPLLDDLLNDTLGVMLYQDQVLEVAMRMGGFSAGQADQLPSGDEPAPLARRMERFREPSRRAPQRTGIAEGDAPIDLRQAARLLGVRLPEEPRLRLRGAGLPVGLAAPLLPGRVLRGAAQQPADGLLLAARPDRRRPAAGLQVLRGGDQPQRGRCLPGEQQVLLGLTRVRGLGEDLAQAIVAEREAHGPYRSLTGSAERTGLPRRVPRT